MNFSAESVSLSIAMTRLRQYRFTLIALIAVLCLLGMQQGAAYHRLSHSADDATSQQKHLPHEKNCDKCVFYAEVGGGAPTTSHPAFDVSAPHVNLAAAPRSLLHAANPSAYSARAPPYFL